MKVFIRALITALCILSTNSSCLSEVSPTTIEAKKSSESAMSDAKGAELTMSAKFEKPAEKEKAIREKAMSSLNSAINAITAAEAIAQDPKETPESKHIATQVITEAKEAIKKAGSVLAKS